MELQLSPGRPQAVMFLRLNTSNCPLAPDNWSLASGQYESGAEIGDLKIRTIMGRAT